MASALRAPDGEPLDHLADPPASGDSRLSAPWRLGRAAAAPVLLAATLVVLGFSSGGFAVRAQAVGASVYVVLTMGAVSLAPGAFRGRRGPFLIGLAALWSLAGWTLASASWSGSEARAVTECARVVLYATTLTLFGVLARNDRSTSRLLGAVAAAFMILCSAGLLARLLPDAVDIGFSQRSYGRLQYPVNYASTLGLLAVVGGLISLAFAAGARRAAGRIVGAAGTPVFVTTLLLTYSRGPLLAGLVALVVLLVAGLSATTVGTLLATVPTTGIAVVVAYHANRLATGDFVSPSAVSQGHRVAAVLVACSIVAGLLRAVLGGLDRLLERRLRSRRPLGRIAARRIAIGAVALGLLGATIVVARELPALRGEYARFTQPGSSQPNVRGRLTDVQSGDRFQAWTVAIADFRRAPVLGRGAGTFVLSWARGRPYEIPFNETHSLYLQMLGELGIVGLGLLLVVLGAIIIGIGLAVRRSERVILSAGLAAVVGWAVAVAVDWHWQMPVGTLWVFAVAGSMLANRSGGAIDQSPAWRRGRWAVVAGLAVAAVVLVKLSIAEYQLDDSLIAFRRADCPSTEASAAAARSAFGVLPGPPMLLGYCAALDGRRALAVREEEQAVSLDPDDWVLHYALATVRAAEGVDPSAAVRATSRLNPLEPLVTNLVARLRGHDPRMWRREVAAIPVVLPTDFDQ